MFALSSRGYANALQRVWVGYNCNMVAYTLSAKQSRFLDEYMTDLNGAAAAVRAGYSRKCAREIAYELLTKPHIQAALAACQAIEAERLGVTRESVVAWLLKALEQAWANELGASRSRLRKLS